MSNQFAPGPGGVLSADIAVPEPEREVRFYARVLTTGDHPLWREGDLLNSLGMPIIGLGARSTEYAQLPLQWMPHIQVADVAASVARAAELGGTVLLHATADDGGSQWAVLLDANQAAFGIIPVVAAGSIPQGDAADSAKPGASVGRIQWLDLTVPDAAATRDFYRQVVGWSVEDVEMKDGEARYVDFNMLADDGKPAAGICHARGVNAGLPPVWLIYLPVGDLGESVRRVEEEGGMVVRSVRAADGRYAFAVIRDLVGAHLALAQA